MPTVKILIDAVGEYNAGDIVTDAPPGLVHMAEVGTLNAATGQRIAELVDETPADSVELTELKARAKELKIPKYTKMAIEELKEAITAAEKEIADAKALADKELAEAEELKALQAKAEELQIVDFEKMNRDELIAAIEAAGGVQGAE